MTHPAAIWTLANLREVGEPVSLVMDGARLYWFPNGWPWDMDAETERWFPVAAALLCRGEAQDGRPARGAPTRHD